MTPELQDRLEQSLAPFHHDCIRSVDDMPLSKLQQILRLIVNALSDSYSDVFIFDDWHEHDGFICDSKPVSWNTIQAALASERTLFDSRHDDFAVRIAIHPANFDWLLRYNIDDEDESDFLTATCDFDLSFADDSKLTALADELLTQFPSILTRCKSQAWFLSNSGA